MEKFGLRGIPVKHVKQMINEGIVSGGTVVSNILCK